MRAGRTPSPVSSTGSPATVTSRARGSRTTSPSSCVSRSRRGLAAAQHGLDPRRQLARRERLHDVVVGADLEPGDAVGLLVARGQHQDRHASSVPGSRGKRRSRPVRAGRCRGSPCADGAGRALRARPRRSAPRRPGSRSARGTRGRASRSTPRPRRAAAAARRARGPALPPPPGSSLAGSDLGCRRVAVTDHGRDHPLRRRRITRQGAHRS